jgi:outer membrane protein TolC
MDGRVTETMIGTDILSLLGIGPRAAERALARALRSERICAHHERARALVGELAEAFAVERALRGLEPPEAALDIEAFESAGLASKSVLAAARSVRAEGEAERRILDAQWQDARREIARLIAAAPDAALDIAPVGDGWPSLAEPDRQRLVLARGDLQRLLASWRVADRRYRYAVARQYPNLVVGLGTNVDMRTPMQLVRLELPLDAPAEARAASHARDAAFHRLDAGVLGAMHDAESARLGLVESEAMLESSTERQRAARALLRAQGALLETTPTALGAYVLVAGREIDAAHQVREAAVAAARARVRAARAAGWPAPEMLGDAR